MKRDETLTDRQRQVFNFIVARTGKGRPPTIQEIADHLGVTSLNTPGWLVARLEAKGWIARDPGARGIRVLKNGGR